MKGAEAARAAGLALQFNITVMRPNYEDIPRILNLADDLDVEIVLLYHLIPAGRGGQEELEISREQYAELARFVKERQRTAHPLIEPTCAPQFWPYLLGGNGHRTKRLAEAVFHGCVAGSGLCYVKPDGDVWSCPFIPISAGNVRQTPLSQIWQEAEVFQILRNKEKYLKGACGQCGYHKICGGCRGRAYAHTNDYLAEDPLCFLSHSSTTTAVP